MKRRHKTYTQWEKKKIVTQPAVHDTFVDTRSWWAGAVPEEFSNARDPEIGLVAEGQYATVL